MSLDDRVLDYDPEWDDFFPELIFFFCIFLFVQFDRSKRLIVKVDSHFDIFSISEKLSHAMVKVEMLHPGSW